MKLGKKYILRRLKNRIVVWSYLVVSLSLIACVSDLDRDFDSVAEEQHNGAKRGDAFQKRIIRRSVKKQLEQKRADSSIKRAGDYPLSRPIGAGRLALYQIGRLREVFNDSNYRQLYFANRLGIRPITSVRDCYRTRRPLVKIESNTYYKVDSLTHSFPFLVPEAAQLLHDIGCNFNDSLQKRGGKGYQIKVTSLLRTPSCVKRLRRINRNATEASTHQYGTTFDISYTKFNCLDSTIKLHEGDLKNLLAEVLFDLRSRGRCLVKYERHTPCFHITVIK